MVAQSKSISPPMTRLCPSFNEFPLLLEIRCRVANIGSCLGKANLDGIRTSWKRDMAEVSGRVIKDLTGKVNIVHEPSADSVPFEYIITPSWTDVGIPMNT